MIYSKQGWSSKESTPRFPPPPPTSLQCGMGSILTWCVAGSPLVQSVSPEKPTFSNLNLTKVYGYPHENELNVHVHVATHKADVASFAN